MRSHIGDRLASSQRVATGGPGAGAGSRPHRRGRRARTIDGPRRPVLAASLSCTPHRPSVTHNVRKSSLPDRSDSLSPPPRFEPSNMPPTVSKKSLRLLSPAIRGARTRRARRRRFSGARPPGLDVVRWLYGYTAPYAREAQCAVRAGRHPLSAVVGAGLGDGLRRQRPDRRSFAVGADCGASRALSRWPPGRT